MKERTGFVVKTKFSGIPAFNHLTPGEFHLVKRCIRDSDDGKAEIKMVSYTDEDQFILIKF